MASTSNPNKAKKAKEAPSQPIEAEVVAEPTKTDKPATSWSVDSLFWGALLVTVGVLLLLGNLGIVDVDWMNLWRLWPLAIVFAGLSIIKTRHWAWRVLMVLAVLASLAAVVAVGTGAFTPDGRDSSGRQTQTVTTDKSAKDASVEIEAGASDLTLDSHSSSDVAKAVLENSELELVQESRLEGDTQNVKLATKKINGDWFVRGGATWRVDLTENLPLDVTVNAGASRLTADLSRTRLQSLVVDAGASSVDIKLGDKEASQTIAIDSGASSVTLRVPKASGVSVMIDGSLNSKDLGDLKETSKDTYQSDGFDTASKKITIRADIGVASFKIERY